MVSRTDNWGPVVLPIVVITQNTEVSKAGIELARSKKVLIRSFRVFLDKSLITEPVIRIIAAVTNVLGNVHPNYPAIAQVSNKDVPQISTELLCT